MCVYRESIILFRNLDLEISTEITVSKKLYKKILDPQIWFLDIRFYVQNFYDRSDSNLLAIRSIPSLPRIKYSFLSTIDNIFLCSISRFLFLNRNESYLFHFTRDTFTSIAIKNISLDQPKEGLKQIFFSDFIESSRFTEKSWKWNESNSSIGRKILRKQFFERTIDKFSFKDSSFHVL